MAPTRPNRKRRRPSAVKRLRRALANSPPTALQLRNQTILLSVALLTVPFPNDLRHIVAAVVLAGSLDAMLSRARYGSWRMPWASMLATVGMSMIIEAHAPAVWAVAPLLLVWSKHLLRIGEHHLWNPNNFAMATLLGLTALDRAGGLEVAIGINAWGSAPWIIGLMVLFGTMATWRVERLDLALAYLVLCSSTAVITALLLDITPMVLLVLALSPLQMAFAFFMITDPATSPRTPLAKLISAGLLAAIALPGLFNHIEAAPIFALFVVAPLRGGIEQRLPSWVLSEEPKPPEGIEPSTS